MSLPDQETRQLRLANVVKTFRERAGLTEAELAQRMGEDSSFSTKISETEAGQAPISADHLWRFLDASGASFAELDMELDPEAADPRILEIADHLDRMGRG